MCYINRIVELKCMMVIQTDVIAVVVWRTPSFRGVFNQSSKFQLIPKLIAFFD